MTRKFGEVSTERLGGVVGSQVNNLLAPGIKFVPDLLLHIPASLQPEQELGCQSQSQSQRRRSTDTTTTLLN
jgi:hypothetical protein